MATRKFLTSVADVYGYDSQTGALLFQGKTLLDSSMEVSLGSAPVRGGRGNQLQYIYYHTGEMKIALTETQWNLQFLGYTVGSTPSTNTNIFMEESVAATVTGNTVTATVTTATPLVFGNDTSILGWALTPDGNTIAGTFSGSNFTGTKLSTDTLTTAQQICIRYYAANSSASYITVNANMIPSVVRLVMEAQLNSADVTTNKIGIVQIIVPTATLSGAFTISMKADGVSNTPLNATALAYTPTEAASDACVATPYYAKIIEIIDTANWWDNVIALAIEGGDFSQSASGATGILTVWAVPSSGAPFKPPVVNLNFASSDTGVFKVGLNDGYIVGVSGTTGPATISVEGNTGTSTSLEASCVATATV